MDDIELNNDTKIENFRINSTKKKILDIQSTIDGISRISIKKGKKHVIPRRTESKRLKTVSEFKLLPIKLCKGDVKR
jgi:hypothetical protein